MLLTQEPASHEQQHEGLGAQIFFVDLREFAVGSPVDQHFPCFDVVFGVSHRLDWGIDQALKFIGDGGQQVRLNEEGDRLIATADGDGKEARCREVSAIQSAFEHPQPNR